MQDLLSPLTQDGHRVMVTAGQIAKRHHQPVIDSEILLLGLLTLSGSQAESVLTTFHIKVENLVTRLAASVKLAARQNEPPPEIGFSNRKFKLSTDSTAILTEAMAEAQQHELEFVDTRLLMLGMLRCPHSKAGQFLAQYGVTLAQFREAAKLKEMPAVNAPRPKKAGPSAVKLGQISPLFVGLVLFTILSGYLTYARIGNARAAMLFFVMCGWIISVALHEFGHALVAYWGGDKSVVEKGYLTLDPLKYTHPLLSIVMPIIFLILGGIGLPGGAVYINPQALRSNGIRSLTSAAGPIASALCALGLALGFLFFTATGYESIALHLEFWAGVALLAFLQITAIVINLLPIPGLDGFGIIDPFLPPNIAATVNTIRPFGFFILYALFFIDSPIQNVFWEEIWNLTFRISPDLGVLAYEGFQLFRFWR
jgi:Zn-dependent protease